MLLVTLKNKVDLLHVLSCSMVLHHIVECIVYGIPTKIKIIYILIIIIDGYVNGMMIRTCDGKSSRHGVKHRRKILLDDRISRFVIVFKNETMSY